MMEAEARATLEQLRSRPARIQALAPFEAALEVPSPVRLLRHAQERQRPAVGYFCALAPLELIAAAGAVPVRLDAGSAECAALAGDALHRDACPLVRSAWGVMRRLREQPELFATLRLLIVPRACDWKAALPELLAEEFGIEVVALDLPRGRRTETAREGWRRQIAEVGRVLARATGQTITRQALRDAIALYARASRVSRALNAAMAAPNPPLSGTDALLVFSAALLVPIEEWIAAGEALVVEFGDMTQFRRIELGSCPRIPLSEQSVGEGRPRLLLAGSPCVWPHFAVPALAEECGGLVVADESCTGSRVLYDAVHVDEGTVADMTAAVADRYLLPSACPVFLDPDDRLLRLEALVDDFRPDGVLYHVLKSCYVYDMQLQAVVEQLQERNLPVLRIETDYGEAGLEALRTRLEAFIETLGRPKTGDP